MTAKRYDPAKIAILTFLGVGAFPVVLLATVFTHAYRAALYLGRWPYYGHPDPKDLPAGFHPPSQLLAYLVPVLALALSTIVPGHVIFRRVRRTRWLYAAISVVMLVWITSFVIASLDPGGVIEWIVD
jgi:hypothetical protein